MSIEVLFVRKLLLVDLKLRCIRPDFDDFDQKMSNQPITGQYFSRIWNTGL